MLSLSRLLGWGKKKSDEDSSAEPVLTATEPTSQLAELASAREGTAQSSAASEPGTSAPSTGAFTELAGLGAVGPCRLNQLLPLPQSTEPAAAASQVIFPGAGLDALLVAREMPLGALNPFPQPTALRPFVGAPRSLANVTVQRVTDTDVSTVPAGEASSALPLGPWMTQKQAEIALKAHALRNGFALKRETGVRPSSRRVGEKFVLVCHRKRKRPSVASLRKTKKSLGGADGGEPECSCRFSATLELMQEGWALESEGPPHNHPMGESMDEATALALATAGQKLPKELVEMGRRLKADGHKTVDVRAPRRTALRLSRGRAPA